MFNVDNSPAVVVISVVLVTDLSNSVKITFELLFEVTYVVMVLGFSIVCPTAPLLFPDRCHLKYIYLEHLGCLAQNKEQDALYNNQYSLLTLILKQIEILYSRTIGCHKEGYGYLGFVYNLTIKLKCKLDIFTICMASITLLNKCCV